VKMYTEMVMDDATPPGGSSGSPADRGTSPAGDDDSLILWMLSLTPTQRLAVAQGFVDSIYALRNGRRA
jgi:hypothetical protein